MKLSEAQARERLSSERNILNILSEENKEHKPLYQTNNAAGYTELSEPEKVVIAVAGRFDSSRNVSKELGVGKNTVSDLARGMDGRRFNEGLKNKVDSIVEGKKNEIKSIAVEKISDLILGITEDKITRGDVKSLASAANAVAGVFEKMEGRSKGMSIGNVVFMTPRVKEMKEFDIIEAEASVG